MLSNCASETMFIRAAIVCRRVSGANRWRRCLNTLKNPFIDVLQGQLNQVETFIGNHFAQVKGAQFPVSEPAQGERSHFYLKISGGDQRGRITKRLLSIISKFHCGVVQGCKVKRKIPSLIELA